MKKVLWILVVLVVGGYFVNSYLENKATEEAERAEATKKRTQIEAAVSQVVARTDAIDDWESQLNAGILTIELERLWVRPRPILFRGTIKDIFTADLSRYTVLLEKSMFLGPTLQLSLSSSKEIIDSFLEKHFISSHISSHYPLFGSAENVAVVARIHSIRTRKIQHCECSGHQDELYGYVEDEEVKIGDGELIDILYLEM
ncbi:MAG: hypothetical protein OXI53_09845 [Nitrospira sp.]|nr:hypothetical protein [Nitrospira sp.]